MSKPTKPADINPEVQRYVTRYVTKLAVAVAILGATFVVWMFVVAPALDFQQQEAAILAAWVVIPFGGLYGLSILRMILQAKRLEETTAEPGASPTTVVARRSRT